MAASRWILLPREHGTYGEVFFPLLTAYATAGITAASLALGAGVVAGYVAHESFLVLLGFRGPKAIRDEGAIARRSLVVLLTVAGAGVLLGLAGSAAARSAVWLPALASALVLLLASAGRERTLGAELGVAAALPAWAIPVAVAAGGNPAEAYTVWAIWTVFFWAATFSVWAVIARSKRRDPRAARAASVGLTLAAMAVAAALLGRGLVPLAAILALAPAMGLVTAVAVLPIPAQRLRKVGWSYIAASLVVMVGLVLGYGGWNLR